jgi:hypothetical protein
LIADWASPRFLRQGLAGQLKPESNLTQAGRHDRHQVHEAGVLRLE